MTSIQDVPRVPPIPWTEAYQELREHTFRAVLADPAIMQCFAEGGRLPAGYGRGLDERCIEYPWLLAHVPVGLGRVLDAGAAVNHAFLLDQPALADKRLHIVTLAPEAVCYWQRGISYLFEDLRGLPLQDSVYDMVICVSTLEHVGCDNTFYTGPTPSAEQRVDDFPLAVRELHRVLKAGGQLLLTVPYGRYQYHGAFQQFDRRRLRQAEEAFGDMEGLTERFYRISRQGWQLGSEEECSDCEYVQWVADLMRTGCWPDPPRLEIDYAAAARAVACVRMIKA
jgi:SAM-dependent methyltransferase